MARTEIEMKMEEERSLCSGAGRGDDAGLYRRGPSRRLARSSRERTRDADGRQGPADGEELR